MARKSPVESCFVLTLPLRCEKWQRDRLDTLFRVGNDIKNNLIAYEKKQYNQLVQRRDYRALQKALSEAYKAGDKATVKELGKKRTELLQAAGFSQYAVRDQANKYRKHYRGKRGKGYLVPATVGANIGFSVWRAFEKLLYGNGKDVHFSKWSEFLSITGEGNKCSLRYYDGGIFQVTDMRIRVALDKKDPYGYQREALSRPIRRCAVVRRWHANGWQYFAQLTLAGTPPVKVRPDTGEVLHPLGKGPVGHDITLQTIASCGQNGVNLTELAGHVLPIDRELRRINRAMARSLKATNPKMFTSDGAIIPKTKLPPECINNRGARRWRKSKHYKELEAQLRELYRRQKELRTQWHNELANKLLSLGDTHYIEDIPFAALARKFGKLITKNAPAILVETIERKVQAAGGQFQKVPMYPEKEEIFTESTISELEKVALNRWFVMLDGTRIQWNLYSAFLLMNTDETLQGPNRKKCKKTYSEFLSQYEKESAKLSRLLKSEGITDKIAS